MKKLTLALGASLLVSGFAQAATPTSEELYKIIQQQQSEIDALKNSSMQQEERLNLTADSIEKTSVGASATTIGGYAELHYNNLNTKGVANDVDKIDFHRFVLFIGHEFNKTTRFFSELEVEHVIASSNTKHKGEVELEQAYVEHDMTATQKVRIGQFLIPVGLLNETHEPDTFYGVERNNVERNIIPTTWWEGGVGFNGQLGAGFSYDAALTSGLFLDTKAGQFKVRDSRQRVSEAPAEDFATTGRIKYTGVKGLEVAMTVQYQNDMSQGKLVNDRALDAYLTEAHVVYTIQGFTIKSLYAQWHIDRALNTISSAAAGSARQDGFYVEPSYRINEQWGVFARGSEWDNNADDAKESGIVQYDVGVNYWLHPNVALKFDIQDQHARNNNKASELDGFNLGVGLSY